jgi:small-conductance mechanosensitive channel
MDIKVMPTSAKNASGVEEVFFEMAKLVKQRLDEDDEVIPVQPSQQLAGEKKKSRFFRKAKQ